MCELSEGGKCVQQASSFFLTWISCDVDVRSLHLFSSGSFSFKNKPIQSSSIEIVQQVPQVTLFPRCPYIYCFVAKNEFQLVFKLHIRGFHVYLAFIRPPKADACVFNFTLYYTYLYKANFFTDTNKFYLDLVLPVTCTPQETSLNTWAIFL